MPCTVLLAIQIIYISEFAKLFNADFYVAIFFSNVGNIGMTSSTSKKKQPKNLSFDTPRSNTRGFVTFKVNIK